MSVIRGMWKSGCGDCRFRGAGLNEKVMLEMGAEAPTEKLHHEKG